MYSLRLEETQKHGDIKLSYKDFSEQVMANQDAKARKKMNMFEISRTFDEIVSYFCALAFKHAQDPGFVEGIF